MQPCLSATVTALEEQPHQYFVANDQPERSGRKVAIFRPYFSNPKGSSTEWAGWVNQRAPVSVMTMWSSSRTPNSP